MNVILFLLALLVALTAIGAWYRDQEREQQRRWDSCPHPPAQQMTMRVNNIITMNPALLHRVIPGRRHMRKHCMACGWQRNVYSNRHQPYQKFLDEWNQETIDRDAEFAARKWYHEQELANAERIRKLKRDRKLEKDGRA